MKGGDWNAPKVVIGNMFIHTVRKRDLDSCWSPIGRNAERHIERYPETSGFKTMKYAVVLEEYEDGGFGAYVPDLPGCVAAASSRPEIERLIAEAISLHIDSLREHGNPIPIPNSTVAYIEPAAVS